MSDAWQNCSLPKEKPIPTMSKTAAHPVTSIRPPNTDVLLCCVLDLTMEKRVAAQSNIHIVGTSIRDCLHLLRNTFVLGSSKEKKLLANSSPTTIKH